MSADGVGCFDPVKVVALLERTFGDAFVFNLDDLFEGHYERIYEILEEGSTGRDLVLRDEARKKREISPRYTFQLRTGSDTFVAGKVDRYSIWITWDSEAEFPQHVRDRFVTFLQSLQLGVVTVTELE